MSTSPTWINRLERLLDLRELPHTNTHMRMLRLFQALWLRPDSLNGTLNNTAGQAQNLNALYVMLRIVVVALHDIVNPITSLFEIVVRRPFRAFRRTLARLTDRLVAAARLEKRLAQSRDTILRFKTVRWALGLSALALFLLQRKPRCHWPGNGSLSRCATCLPFCSGACLNDLAICA